VECRAKFRPIWSSSATKPTDLPDKIVKERNELELNSHNPSKPSEANFMDFKREADLNDNKLTPADRENIDDNHSSETNDQQCETPGSSCSRPHSPVPSRSHRQPNTRKTTFATETASAIQDDVLPPVYAGGLQILVVPPPHLSPPLSSNSPLFRNTSLFVINR
jgi:hypothetical protein